MSPTFNGPYSLDESRNISQWIQYAAERSPTHPFFTFASPGSEPCILSWSEVRAAVERAAYYIESQFCIAAPSEDGANPPVVGVLANLDSISYYTLLMGILRAGGTAFLISNKNSPAALSHLLKKTGTHQLFVSTDEAIQTLVSGALVGLDGDYSVAVHKAPTFRTLYESGGRVVSKSLGMKTQIHAPAVILHSSGSTSFPKPLILNHRVVLEWAGRIDLQDTDLSTDRLAIHAIPVFHGMGFVVLCWALRTGLTLAVFPPQSPPVVPSPASFMDYAVASQSRYFFCVPIFLEIWGHDPEAIAHLTKLKGIIFGGGPFNRPIGDELAQQGVPLIQLYGCTEIGPGNVMIRRDPKEWEWMTILPTDDPRFLPQEGTDTFELVYVKCPGHTPVVFNTSIDGREAFATNDLVVRHPTDPLTFKVQGRKDDQIMLSSGEKTNPDPLEGIIRRNPLVKAALMFGRGRDQNGIIIQPASGHEFDPTDISELSRFRTDIWTSIIQANEFAPTHSRLFKEMILVTHISKPIGMTPKGTLRRAATLEAYKGEIDAAYDAVQTSTQLDVPLPRVWNPDEVLGYVRRVVQNVMRKAVADDADIFEHGGDSLQATYIRNSLVHSLRQMRKSEVGKVTQNFVYENPTIVGLAARLGGVVNAVAGSTSDEIALKLQDMDTIISKCSAHFPEHQPDENSRLTTSGEVVLLTGTTGGLGSQLLAYLASSSEVSRLYAVNRRYEGKSLRERQSDALSGRGLDVGILDLPKVALLEGDTAMQDLDIDPLLYNEIRDSVTLIIHNAWKVNFNLGFMSFEPNVRGVRTLVDLALGSPRRDPPRFIFASSVGLFRNWNTAQGRPLEASIEDPKLVLGSGYGESKLVGERILENAARSTPLRPIIVRIGQMTSTPSGAWNYGDWLPAIVRSSQILGVLPTRDDCIAWIPLETAAQAIFEFRHSNSQYLHLAHPNPSSWNSVFDAFSTQLAVPLVSWMEWLAKLEMCDGGAAKNPALHLLEFFRGCSPIPLKNREAPGIPLMDLTQALRFSPTLSDASLPQTGREDAGRWLKYWVSIGFLTNSAVE